MEGVIFGGLLAIWISIAFVVSPELNRIADALEKIAALADDEEQAEQKEGK